MRRWHGLDEVPPGWGRSVVTIGVFDGVHRGHQRIVGGAADLARELGLRSVVITFDPHPDEVVRPGTHPPLLSTPKRRAELLSGLGTDDEALPRRRQWERNGDLAPAAPESGPIDNSKRTKHGALLDAEILAEVYIELIGARQAQLILVETDTAASRLDAGAIPVRVRPLPLPSRLTVDERDAHVTFVATLGDSAIWREYLPDRGLVRSA